MTTSVHSRFFLPPLFTGRLARWLAVALAALALCGPARAQPLDEADAQGVRAAVEGQLQALANDDAPAAFSFAAPSVQQAVGTPAEFMAMVHASYPAIYRPASTAFLMPEAHHGQVIQRVQLMDSSGSGWLALYSLQRQQDRSWRITGCSLVPNRARMT